MQDIGRLLYPIRAVDGWPNPADVRMGRLAGYAALTRAYDLNIGLPLNFATSDGHQTVKLRGLTVLTRRHRPEHSLQGHLVFALKYEGVNPEVLKALFAVIDTSEIEQVVRARPTGQYARRIWFLYEWLTGRRLNLPPLRRASYVNAIDPSLQHVARSVNSPRHRVRNNLPTTPDWYPAAVSRIGAAR